MTNIIARHGDMTIFKVSKDQVKGMETAETKKLTLGLGEVTGHSHEVLALDDSTIIEHQRSYCKRKHLLRSKRKSCYHA